LFVFAAVVVVVAVIAVVVVKLKTNLYSAIKSEDSEALDGGTS